MAFEARNGGSNPSEGTSETKTILDKIVLVFVARGAGQLLGSRMDSNAGAYRCQPATMRGGG